MHYNKISNNVLFKCSKLEMPMTDAILQALLDWNPWIEGELPEALVGVPRENDLASFLELPEIKVLEGARRVGKSTLLYQLVKHGLGHGKKVLYINFDDETLVQHSLKDIYYAYLQRDKVDYLFLDEIQHCENWVHFVRQLYDTQGVSQIWVSGSNASLIKQEFKSLLTGRNITLTIHPLSFREFLTFKGEEKLTLPFSSEKEARVIGHFKTYLQQGSFPAIALRDFYQKELLINYFEDIIYKDIVTRYEVNVTKIKETGLYLATNSAKNFNYRSLSKALNIHHNTAKDYLDYFIEVFLFSVLYKFDYSLKQQFSTDKKIYAVDTGIAAANAFRFSDDKGRMLENLVYNELKRRNKTMYFHKQKKECDFIVKEGTDIVSAIQVSYSLADAGTRKREIAGLVDAMEYFQLEEGLILTMAEEEILTWDGKEYNYKITVKPIWKWLLHTAK